MAKIKILGIHVTNRVKNVAEVQKILSEHGCNIKTRLGLHEVDEKTCSTSGLLIIELFGKASECTALEKKLNAVKGLKVQKMEF